MSIVCYNIVHYQFISDHTTISFLFIVHLQSATSQRVSLFFSFAMFVYDVLYCQFIPNNIISIHLDNLFIQVKPVAYSNHNGSYVRLLPGRMLIDPLGPYVRLLLEYSSCSVPE